MARRIGRPSTRRGRRAIPKAPTKVQERPRRPSEAAPLPGLGLRVAMATPEASPFAKAGGLGEVLGSLPKALERLGADVSVIMPAYRSVFQGGFPVEDTGIRLAVPVSDRTEKATLLKTRVEKAIPVYLVRADKYFDRDQLYGTAEGDYLDNAERFAFFARAVLEVLRQNPPQVLHCHDWQSALAIAFLKAQPERYPELASAKTVFSVHNAGYQGLFWHLDWHLLNLDWGLFNHRQLEFHGRVNYLKGGLVFADAIATVSPSYAEELKTPEQGCGLEGVFQERAADLMGILNGADYDVWDPRRDAFVARTYGPGDLSGKATCKADLQGSFGLQERSDVPLIGMVSRLVAQKGMDLLEQALDELLARDVQLAILGAGEARFEELFRQLPARYPGKAGVVIAYDDGLSHKVMAGADMFLMPSLYEPAGLGQVYGMRYGAIPIVRATGGLKDTVEDYDPATGRGTGFLFGPYETTALLQAIDRALELFGRKQEWAALVGNAMSADFSWERSARAYIELYRKLLPG